MTNDYKPISPSTDVRPNVEEQTEAEWLDGLHGGDNEINEIAAALEQTYHQLGSPMPLEKGHWLALASAIMDVPA